MVNAAALLKLEAEDEIRTGFKSSSPSPLELSDDLEASSEAKDSLQCGSDTSEETGPFAAADRRFLPLEEKLNFSKVLLTVKRFHKVPAAWCGHLAL